MTSVQAMSKMLIGGLGRNSDPEQKNLQKIEAGIISRALRHADSQDGLTMEVQFRCSIAACLKTPGEGNAMSHGPGLLPDKYYLLLSLLRETGPHTDRRGGLSTQSNADLVRLQFLDRVSPAHSGSLYSLQVQSPPLCNI